MVRLLKVRFPNKHEKAVDVAISALQAKQQITQLIKDTWNTNTIVEFKVKEKHLQSALDELESIGVGVRFGQIDVMNVVLSKPAINFSQEYQETASTENIDQSMNERVDSRSTSQSDDKQTISSKSVQSTTSIQFFGEGSSKSKKRRKYRIDDRMTVDEIDAFIDEGNHLTFNYISLLFCASIIAGCGLIGDSATTVIAAMLVSPLMGPILSITFGIAVNNYSIVKKGMRNELVGLCISYGSGIIIGLIACIYYSSDYRSNEMVQRGQAGGLIYGFFVAFASGVAVVIAISMGGINAIVGTAISASLLPPVVNSGICSSMALVFAVHDQEYGDAEDYALFAVVSFSLFLVNFVVIVATGFVTFRFIKKVVPPTKKVLGKSIELDNRLTVEKNTETKSPIANDVACA